jgi:hypothetical protein
MNFIRRHSTAVTDCMLSDVLWRFSSPARHHQCADTSPLYFLCLLCLSFIGTFIFITVDWNLQCPSATAMSSNFNYNIQSFARLAARTSITILNLSPDSQQEYTNAAHRRKQYVERCGDCAIQKLMFAILKLQQRSPPQHLRLPFTGVHRPSSQSPMLADLASHH